jgi:O-methyltransferase
MIGRGIGMAWRIYRALLIAFSLPVLLAVYFRRETGNEYGIGLMTKLSLAIRIARNTWRIPSATHFVEHLAMLTSIMNVPASIEGCIVECGSYKGSSTASLSLAARFCGRRLEVFDSFAGLPEPDTTDQTHTILGRHKVHTYAKGSWSGSLEEVRSNLSRYGDISVCHFNAGYFEQTLPTFQQQCVFVFLDVDLRNSLETCLRHLWPWLQDGCCLFTHEAQQSEIASLFWDSAWWSDQLNTVAPGLIGSGTGLGLLPTSGAYRSDIGYTIKKPFVIDYQTVPQTGRAE